VKSVDMRNQPLKCLLGDIGRLKGGKVSTMSSSRQGGEEEMEKAREIKENGAPSPGFF